MGSSVSFAMLSRTLAVTTGSTDGDAHVDNAAGFAIHGALHMGRPDINAAAHAHSQFGKAFSAMGRNLDIASHGGCSIPHRSRTITVRARVQYSAQQPCWLT